MKIVRGYIPTVDRFTTIPNGWLRDTRLSRKARGLLGELLSHSDGWECSIESLTKSGPEGKSAIRSAVHELESLGYLQRLQGLDESKKFTRGLFVLNDPSEQKPLADFPTTGFPTTDNRTYKKTNSKNTKKTLVSSVDETSKRDDYPQDFKEFWEAFPKRAGTNSKREAHKAWVKAIKEESPANLLAAAKNYAKATTGVENLSTIPMCSSWLNKGYWEQYVGTDFSPGDLLRKWWKDADVEAVAEHTGLRFSMKWPDDIPASQEARDELVFNARREWIASVRDDAIAAMKGAAA